MLQDMYLSTTSGDVCLLAGKSWGSLASTCRDACSYCLPARLAYSPSLLRTIQCHIFSELRGTTSKYLTRQVTNYHPLLVAFGEYTVPKNRKKGLLCALKQLYFSLECHELLEGSLPYAHEVTGLWRVLPQYLSLWHLLRGLEGVAGAH